MRTIPTRPDETVRGETPRAPAPFRQALAELVQVGMSVARLVGRTAEAEMALADAAARAGVAGGVSPLAASLAEAIEADQAAAAAGEARRSVVGRTEIVAAAFAQVSRAVRRTVLLAERLDRGWARTGAADDRHAMARRQIARAASDAIARDADGADAERLGEALRERLDSLDAVEDLGGRPTEEIIRDICRDLGLDPAPILFKSLGSSKILGQYEAPPRPRDFGLPGANTRARASPAKEHPS